MPWLTTTEERPDDVRRQTRHSEHLAHPPYFEFEAACQFAGVGDLAVIDQPLPVEALPSVRINGRSIDEVAFSGGVRAGGTMTLLQWRRLIARGTKVRRMQLEVLMLQRTVICIGWRFGRGRRIEWTGELGEKCSG